MATINTSAAVPNIEVQPASPRESVHHIHLNQADKSQAMTQQQQPQQQSQPQQQRSRPRTLSISNLVGKARRAYSVSSAYPPKMIHPSLVPASLQPPAESPVDGDVWFRPKNVTPAQRRNSVAAAHRKYEDFEQKMEAAPLLILVSTYLNYFVLILLGHLRDILGKVFKRKEYAHLRINQVGHRFTSF